jgi:hypothetical protein
MSYSTLKCRYYFRTVLEETLRQSQRQRGYSINVMFCKSIKKSYLLIDDRYTIDNLEEGDRLFDYIYELYTKLVLSLSGHYCGIHDTHIEEEISYDDDDRNYKEECIRDMLAELESSSDFIITYSGRDYTQPVLFYEEIYDCELDKLQPLFIDVINDIYEKYKELMETSSLLELSLETFFCYITIDEEEYDVIEDKSIIYFTPQKYVDTLSLYTHEKEDVVKCILYCLERQDEIPPELALLILSFIGFKRISLFEKYFELLDVEDGYISSLY